MGAIRSFLCAVIVGFGVALADTAAGQNPRSIIDGAYQPVD